MRRNRFISMTFWCVLAWGILLCMTGMAQAEPSWVKDPDPKRIAGVGVSDTRLGALTLGLHKLAQTLDSKTRSMIRSYQPEGEGNSEKGKDFESEKETSVEKRVTNLVTCGVKVKGIIKHFSQSVNQTRTSRNSNIVKLMGSKKDDPESRFLVKFLHQEFQTGAEKTHKTIVDAQFDEFSMGELIKLVRTHCGVDEVFENGMFYTRITSPVLPKK